MYPGGKMKRLMMTALAILVSASAIADIQSTGLSKNSKQLQSLGSSFKSNSTVVPKIDSNDITMGYAGQDVSSKTHSLA